LQKLLCYYFRKSNKPNKHKTFKKKYNFVTFVKIKIKQAQNLWKEIPPLLRGYF